MRILQFLFLSFFILGLASCSSDDDDIDPPPQEATVTGEWDVTQFTMEGTIYDEDATITFDAVANDLTGNDMTFHGDNTLSGNNAPFEMAVDSDVDGMEINYTTTMSSVMTHEGEWSRDGNTLYLQEDGSDTSEEFTIETLNSTTLKLSGDQNSITTDSDFPPGSVFDVTITLKR